MQRSTLRNGALRRSTLCTALALCFVSGAVMAQSNASGVVFGRVAQAEGTTVHLQTLVDDKPTMLSFDGTDHSIRTGGEIDDARKPTPGKTR